MISGRFCRRFHALVWISIGMMIGCSSEQSVEDVRALLDARMPLGTPYQHVLSTLDSLSIDHTAYDSIQHDIAATIPGYSGNFLLHKDILLRFVFDSLGTLTEREVEEAFVTQ